MIVEQMRVPDLWLKRELALALLPPGSDLRRVTNQILAECVRGPQGTASKFNHLIAGDDPVRVADDLFYLAATLEFLVLEGPPEGFGRKDIDAYVERVNRSLALWPDPILGTFGEFAHALMHVVERRADYALRGADHFWNLMASAVHQNLHEVLGDVADLAGGVAVLSGSERNWASAVGGPERIIRQPTRERARVTEGDFVQLIVPHAPKPQIVFGFELRTDARAVTDPWRDVGSWFAPRYQPAAQAMALLAEFEDDAKNARAESPGDYWLQIIGIDAPNVAPEMPTLPEAITKLIDGYPAEWRREHLGYAETVACVTFLNRLERERKVAANKRQRLEDANHSHPEDAPIIKARPRLYHSHYTVVARNPAEAR